MASPPSAYLAWDIILPCLGCCRHLWVRPPPILLPGVKNFRTDKPLQIADQAIFGDCIGAIAWVPTVVSLLVLALRYGLHPVWCRRPIWLRNFAAEDLQDPLDDSAELVNPAKQKTWMLSVIVLLTSSAIGLVMSLLAGLSTNTGPLFLTPFIAHVSSCFVTWGRYTDLH